MPVPADFPPELLSHIFSFLDDPLPSVPPWARRSLRSLGLTLSEGPPNETVEDRVNSSWLVVLSVCRYWRSIALSQTTRPVPHRPYTEDKTLSIIESIRPGLLDLNLEMSFRECRGVWDAIQMVIREHGDRLHTIDVWLEDERVGNSSKRGTALIGSSRLQRSADLRVAELTTMFVDRLSEYASESLPPAHSPNVLPLPRVDGLKELFRSYSETPFLHTLRVTGPICSSFSTRGRFSMSLSSRQIKPLEVHIPVGLFDTLCELELCNCSLSSPTFADAKALKKLSLIAVPGLWAFKEVVIRPNLLTLFTRLEELCLVNESFPSNSTLKAFGKVEMPRLARLRLGGTLRRVADFLDAISMSASVSLDITCVRHGPPLQQDIIHHIAPHFAPASVAGDVFTHLSVKVVNHQTLLQCSTPNEGATILRCSSSITISIIWNRTQYFEDGSPVPHEMVNHIADACKLLPLERCEKVMWLDGFPVMDQDNCADFIPLLQDVSVLHVEYNVLRKLLRFLATSRDAHSPISTATLASLSELRIMYRASVHPEVYVRDPKNPIDVLYSCLGEFSGQNMYELVRYECHVAGQDFAVYFNDEEVYMTKDGLLDTNLL